jgi:biopolymer transport protein ExbD
MNALIDVCLVLHVFFMLTTTYAALQKMLDDPSLSADKQGALVVTQKDVKDLMIQVKAVEGPSGPVITVEGQPVNEAELVPVLRRFVGQEHKTELLIDHDRQVPHGTVVAIIDAAKGAGIAHVNVLVPKEELNR